MIKTTIQAAILCSAMAASAQAVTTMYDVTFTTDWTTANDAATPGSAHFSPLIGATHNSTVKFWETGALSTPGITQVAESGGTGTFSDEIDDAITAGTADILYVQSGGNDAVDTLTFTITVDSDHSLITLVSMIAPSPDWFVGIRDFDLRAGGSWLSSATVGLNNYDAGTRSGSGFSLGGPVTSDNIQLLSTAEPTRFGGAGGASVSSLTFTRVVPEPSSTLLSGISILALGLRRRR